MSELKGRYDAEVVKYVESLIELEGVVSTIKSLGTRLETKHLNDFLVDIPTRYGYLGNLGENNTSLVIHESIVPAVTGQEIWRLIRERKTE